VDHFVRYPYPKSAISYYKKEFAPKNSHARGHKQAFNLEKETKIINPHKMDMHTTFKESFKAHKGPHTKPKKRVFEADHAPIATTSHYQQLYPDWRNGQDVLIEKTPQFPVYSLPFRGASSYKQTFRPDTIE
jgi:hypothetical protein